MYTCFHDCLPFMTFWQERDAISQALIANLRQQITALQVDDDDDAEEEEQEGGEDVDDDAPDDKQHVTSCF